MRAKPPVWKAVTIKACMFTLLVLPLPLSGQRSSPEPIPGSNLRLDRVHNTLTTVRGFHMFGFACTEASPQALVRISGLPTEASPRLELRVYPTHSTADAATDPMTVTWQTREEAVVGIPLIQGASWWTLAPEETAALLDRMREAGRVPPNRGNRQAVTVLVAATDGSWGERFTIGGLDTALAALGCGETSSDTPGPIGAGDDATEDPATDDGPGEASPDEIDAFCPGAQPPIASQILNAGEVQAAINEMVESGETGPGGRTEVVLCVDSEEVSDVIVRGSSGSPIVDAAAVRVARLLRYRVQPARVKLIIPVELPGGR